MGQPKLATEWTLNSYDIISKLGEGAFGEVYLAKKGQAEYAIKTLRDIKKIGSVESFRREAFALASLDHPNIVKVIEFGEQEDCYYLVLPIVKGKTLAESNTQGLMSEKEVLNLFKKVAMALSEIHLHGLIHRDLKPSNILVLPNGEPMLIDFGLVAKVDIKGQNQGKDRDIAGTLTYASPEQLGILKQDLSASSDLYSLGVIIYEAITGMLPIKGVTYDDFFKAHTTQNLDIRARFSRKVSPALTEIVVKLLKKDPKERYSSAHSLLEDLNAIDQLNQDLTIGKELLLDQSKAMVFSSSVNLFPREEEMGNMKGILERVRSSRQGAIGIISAPAGYGKSTLVYQLVRKSNLTKFQFLEGSCSSIQKFTFGAMRGVFSRALDFMHSRDGQGFRKTITNEVLLKLSTVDKRFLSLLPENVSHKSNEQLDISEAVECMSFFLQKYAQYHGQVVLFIDDLHWIDSGTMKLLERLSSEMGENPLFVVLTFRMESGNEAELESFVARFPENVVQKIPLYPISLRECNNFVTTILGRPLLSTQFLEPVHTACRGNPLVLTEFIKNAISNGAISLSYEGWQIDAVKFSNIPMSMDVYSIINERAVELSAEARKVLGAAAHLGVNFNIDVLKKLLLLDGINIDAAIHEGLGMGLLRRHGVDGAITFIHDLIRLVLIDWQSSKVKIANHLAIVAVLEMGENDSRTKLEIAYHLEKGEPTRTSPRLFQACFEAMKICLNEWSHEEALRYGSVCLECVSKQNLSKEDRLKFYLIYSDTLTLRGDYEKSYQHLNDCLQNATGTIEQAEIYERLILTQAIHGLHQQSLSTMSTAFKLMGRPLPSNTFLQIISMLLYWGLSVLMVRTGWRRKTIEPDKQSYYEKLSDLHDYAKFACLFTSKPLVLIQLIVRDLCYSHRLGNPRFEVRATCWYAALWAQMVNLKGLKKYADLAKQRVSEAGDQRSKAVFAFFDYYFNEWIGDHRQSWKFIDQLTDMFRYLNIYERAAIINVVIWQRTRLGHCQKAVSYGLSQLSTLDAMRTPFQMSNVRCIIYSNLMMMGEVKDALRIKAQGLEILKTIAENRFASMAWKCAELEILYDTDELGAEFESLLSEIKSYQIEDFFLNYYMIWEGYARLRQLQKAADKPEKEKYAKLLKKLIFGASFRLKIPRDVCHLYVLRAGLHAYNKKYKYAKRCLAEAESVARQCESAIGLYMVNLQRAYLEKELGAEYLSQNFAMEAATLAERFSWSNRLRRVTREFRVNVANVAGTQTLNTMRATEKITKNIDARYASVLLKIGLTAGTEIDLKVQTERALDEIIEALGAERGFYFEANEKEEISFVTGREQGKKEIDHQEQVSHSYIEDAIKKRVGSVTSNAADSINATESMLSHNLKSIMCAPLLDEGKPVGVIYLDTRLARGVFDEKDLGILQAVAHQLSVSRKMLLQIQRKIEEDKIRSSLGRFFPTDIIEDIVSGGLDQYLRPKSQAVTLVFVDLVGFTEMMSRLQPDIGGEFLNDFLSNMVNIVFETGGTVDKFIGDAIMILFGAPKTLSPELQIQNAIRCASEMHRRMQNLTEKWREKVGVKDLHVRIAMHHGQALIGYFGGSRRLEFTAIGHSVNLASRIHSLCEPGKTIVTDAVRPFLSEKNAHAAGEFSVKGISEKVICYHLTA